MSEEEKKAIEHYKMFEDAIKQTISKGDSELYIDGLEEALKDTEVILNLIEKQQKEIEDKQDEINVLEAQNESIENQFEQAKKEIERLKFFQCNVKCMNRRKSESEK